MVFIIICGVDEAGRGCVIGPMVICIACVNEKMEGKLKKIGVRDSKLLSPSMRKKIYERIRKICNVVIIKITAKRLNVLMRFHSLNEIEGMEIGKALSSLKPHPNIIYVDSPDTEPEKFKKRIKRYYKGDGRIISEHRSDVKYPIVSAASIIAKVERDNEVEKIKKELGYDFNSGYPSDPITINFLKNNIHRKDVQKYVREKWETVDKLKQKKLYEFLE